MIAGNLAKIFGLLAVFAKSGLSKIIYAGVNESGGEFGVYSNNATKGTGLPGQFGVDYAFINKTTVAQFVQDGANLFRWGLGSRFNETYFSEYEDAINYITYDMNSYAILDPHNYMRYNDPSQQPMTGSVIGNTSDPDAATAAQFETFWYALASRFINNEKVIFSINNEPHDMPTSLVLSNDQVAIYGIRAAGAQQLILAPGNGYTGGHSWLGISQGDEPSGNYFGNITDPLNNTAIEIHEYLDVDFSGSHPAIVDEFGGSNNTMCGTELGSLLDYLSENDVYIGWAAWAAGPLWKNNSACCNNFEPVGSLEPGTFGSDGTPSQYYDVWLPYIQPKIPTQDLKRSGMSSLYC
ncbi:hypothetical protein IAT40_000899 [Kwoniella sp. CBS 6097]